eukprot:COSAG06_NODE_36_length_30622_cov_18.404869_11_plen_78_part_00
MSASAAITGVALIARHRAPVTEVHAGTLTRWAGVRRRLDVVARHSCARAQSQMQMGNVAGCDRDTAWSLPWQSSLPL